MWCLNQFNHVVAKNRLYTKILKIEYPGKHLLWQSFHLECVSNTVKPPFKVYLVTSGFEH
jgi:hypothetical protein